MSTPSYRILSQQDAELRVPGSYLLLFHLQQPLPDLQVGRLGRFHLAAGSWFYCGSAWGAGGLQARLDRHWRRQKRLHWHIDYLTSRVTPLDALALVQPEPARARMECIWVQRLLDQEGIAAPIGGFGSSDCDAGCPAHLLYTPPFVSLQTVQEWLDPSNLSATS